METDGSVRLAVHAMGTRFELLLAGEDLARGDLLAAGEAAIEEIESAHERLSAFSKDSVVSRINACAGERAVRVDGEVLGLLELAECVRIGSEGAFDVTIGRLMEARGYTRSPERVCWDNARVSELLIDASASSVMLASSGASVDLGAIAKGWALDLAAGVVRDAGVKSALLHGGTSTIVAVGARPDGRRWRIAVEAPDGGKREVELEDGALSVSTAHGDLGRDGPGHIVDPATGESPDGAEMVVCVGQSAAETDAWSTAAVVLGERPAGAPPEVEFNVWRGGVWTGRGIAERERVTA